MNHSELVQALTALALCLLAIFGLLLYAVIKQAFKPKLSDEEIQEMRTKLQERASSRVVEHHASNTVQPVPTLFAEVHDAT